MFKIEGRALAFKNKKRVNIEEKLYNHANELSGGQHQHVTIARVIRQKPIYIY
ncbi:hypothetical protein [Jeotgalibacillus soli]|nr:hypothetical protein [Jeotgalibacillus soli]